MLLDVGNTWHYVQRANEPGAPLVTLSRTITEHRQIDHNGQAITVSVEMPVVETSAKIQPAIGRLLRNEAGGLYSYGWVNPEGITLFNSPQLVAPLEGRTGQSLDMGGGRFMVCVAADSLVVTDFGEVTADVYELWLDEGTIRVPDIYVVPGVGLTRYYNTEWTMWIVGYEYE